MIHERNTPMSEKEFTLTINGSRGSIPVFGKEYHTFGGRTSSYELQINGYTLILDAGTGIVDAGKHIVGKYFARGQKTPIRTTVICTHLHWDHIQGLPFFAPLFFVNSHVHLIGPSMNTFSFKDKIQETMYPPYFPISQEELPAEISYHEYFNDSMVYIIRTKNRTLESHHIVSDSYEEAGADDIVIKLKRGYQHPKNGTYHIKIEANGKSVVYATDTEGYIDGDANLIRFAKNSTLLMHDSQYTREEYNGTDGMITQGFGHSTYIMATDVARKAQVSNLALIHHDPRHSDKIIRKIERAAKRRFPNSFAVRETQVIDIMKDTLSVS